MKPAVFAYGTLQLPEVMAYVAGKQFPAVPALLHDFARYRIRSKSFPGVRPQPGACVEGMLYQGLPPDVLQSLDEFEDDFYIRQGLDVVTFAGTAVRAQVYIMEQRHYGLLEDTVWDLEHFKRHSLNDFLRRCRHFASNQPR